MTTEATGTDDDPTEEHRHATTGDGFGLPGALTREQAISVLSPIGLLVIWELAVVAGLVPETWFPPPSSIAGVFLDLVRDGTLVTHTAVTLRRLVGAFLLAAVPGIAIGLAMGLSPTVRAIVDPLVSILYPMPKIALLPLIIIIFGFGDSSIIVTASITAFFIVLLNTAAGVLTIDDVLLEAAENFHATGLQKFYKVVLPGAMPLIFTGLRLGLGLSLIVTIAAEFIASEAGLGFFIFNSWQILRVEYMFAGFFVIAIIGYVSTVGLEKLGDRLMPWNDRETIR